MTTILAEIFRHNRWANLGMLDACAPLDRAQLDTAAIGTYGSIALTLLHLASAEGTYVARATGEKIREWVDDEGSFPGLGAFRESLQASGRRLITLAQSEHRDRLVTYQSGGQPSTNPLSMILTKALHHATEHRTHVAASLTQPGIEPPDLDAWFFVHPGWTPG
ncbi:MAG: hypothetical protein C0506_06920 [Anaerolinea sp.]|nr:hypothetical protein [Anaerolinea sp.]